MTKKTRQTDAQRAARMMPAVHRIARAIAGKLPRSVDRDELVGAGSLGLAAALRAHADADDASFERLAVCRIRGAIFDELRAQDALTRSQRQRVKELEADAGEVSRLQSDRQLETERLGLAAQRVDFDLASRSVVDGRATIEDAMVLQQTMRKVERALAGLAPRLAQVIDMSFLQQQTLKQIGAELGVSEARACQLRGDALASMRFDARDTLIPAA
jgi:RNA polymerase sigma factor FliA